MQLFGSLWWDGAQDCFMGLRGGFGKHCTRASLRSDTVEDLIRLLSYKKKCRGGKSGRC